MENETKVKKSSRSSETREKTVRKRGWVPPSSLEAPEPPEGWHHRWIRAETMGFDDTKNMAGKLRSGWELVRADEYPESDYPTLKEGKHAGVIGVGGLLLARIPEEIALQMDAYYNKQTADKEEAINNDLMKEKQAGMRFSNDSQTRVTFGGTKK